MGSILPVCWVIWPAGALQLDSFASSYRPILISRERIYALGWVIVFTTAGRS